MKKNNMIIIALLFATVAAAQHMPLLTYTSFSDTARKSNQLQQYDKIPTETPKITLDGTILERAYYHCPDCAVGSTPYDSVSGLEVINNFGC